MFLHLGIFGLYEGFKSNYSSSLKKINFMLCGNGKQILFV